MAKERSAHAYELELRKMVKERTGIDCEVWLYPLIRTTAFNMVVRDKIQKEMLDLDNFISLVTGSNGQQKTEVSPLLPHYDKIQRTITQQLTAMGLTYDTTPSKVNEDTKKGGKGKKDPISCLYQNVRDVMDNNC